MKTVKNIAITTALIFAVATPAFAALSATDVRAAVKSAAAPGSNVRVYVRGDTVTLSGYVRDTLSLQNIEQAARREGATKVINNVFRSR